MSAVDLLAARVPTDSQDVDDAGFAVVPGDAKVASNLHAEDRVAVAVGRLMAFKPRVAGVGLQLRENSSHLLGEFGLLFEELLEFAAEAGLEVKLKHTARLGNKRVSS